MKLHFSLNPIYMKTIGNSVRLYDRVLVFTGDGPAGLPPDDPSGQTPRNQRSVHRDEGLLRDPSASPLWPPTPDPSHLCTAPGGLSGPLFLFQCIFRLLGGGVCLQTENLHIPEVFFYFQLFILGFYIRECGLNSEYIFVIFLLGGFGVVSLVSHRSLI